MTVVEVSTIPPIVPMTPYNKDMNNFTDFIDYVFSFYGDGGLYDQKRTKEQIAFAILNYLDQCNDDTNMTWGDGDSLDRERVRDFMNDIYGPVLKVAHSVPTGH